MIRLLISLILLVVAGNSFAVAPVYDYLDGNITLYGGSSSGAPGYSRYVSSWGSAVSMTQLVRDYGTSPGVYSCSGHTQISGNLYEVSCTSSTYPQDNFRWSLTSSSCPPGYSIDSVKGQCKSTLATCPSGTSLVNGDCQLSCAPEEDLINGVCTSKCIAPKVRANTIPSLNTASNTCVDPGLNTCSSLGVDASAFIPKCSEMLPNSPSKCLNSDLGEFSVAGCPSIKCNDGTTVIYPAICPVTSCSAGFVLSDIGDGYGKTCVKNLPDTDTQKPCVSIEGSGQPLCAEPEKNCQQVNGKFVCIKEETTPPPGATCYTVNTKLYCLNNQPEIGITKNTVTNPDGSTTTTETRKTNVQGDKPNTTITTKFPDGREVTVGNEPSDVKRQLEYDNQNDQGKVDLSTVEKNTKDTADNTKNLFDKFTEFMGQESDYDKSAIQFDGLDAALDSDKTAFQNFIGEQNPMKTYADSHSFGDAFSSMLPSDTSCSGGIHTTIFGHDFDFEPCDKLAPLREILAWFFSVMTAWQIINMTSKSITRF